MERTDYSLVTNKSRLILVAVLILIARAFPLLGFGHL